MPPATPVRLRDKVEQLAELELGAPQRWALQPAIWRSHLSAVSGLAAALVVAAVVGIGLLWSAAPARPAGPTPVLPTLPGTQGPSFRPAPNGGVVRTSMIVAWTGGLTGVISVQGIGYEITHDGGVTWSEIAPMPTASNLGLDFDFIDAAHGFVSAVDAGAAGSSVSVYRTSDGGVTWRSSVVTTLPAKTGWYVTASAHFADPAHGVVLVSRVQSQTGAEPLGKSDECVLFTTDDGGAAWTKAGNAPCLGAMIWPHWATSLAGSIVSADNPASVTVTMDGGRTWRTGALPDIGSGWRATPQLLLVDGPGRLRLVASTFPTTDGQYTPRPAEVYSSSDAGATWTHQYDVGRIPATTPYLFGGAPIYSVTSLGPDYWLALVQRDDVESSSALVRTLDAGRTWTVVPTAGFNSADGMVWWDARHGMVEGLRWTCAQHDGGCGGDGPHVFLTNDGGATWHQVPF